MDIMIYALMFVSLFAMTFAYLKMRELQVATASPPESGPTPAPEAKAEVVYEWHRTDSDEMTPDATRDFFAYRRSDEDPFAAEPRPRHEFFGMGPLPGQKRWYDANGGEIFQSEQSAAFERAYAEWLREREATEKGAAPKPTQTGKP